MAVDDNKRKNERVKEREKEPLNSIDAEVNLGKWSVKAKVRGWLAGMALVLIVFAALAAWLARELLK